MKFQDSSFNGLKVTVGTKSVTHAPTHARSKSNMPHQLFQSWGHKKIICYTTTNQSKDILMKYIQYVLMYQKSCLVSLKSEDH